MARAKSAVLTPADRKAVIADLKTKIKEAKVAVKEHLQAVKHYTKEAATVQKLADKQTAVVTKLEAELSAIQGQ